MLKTILLAYFIYLSGRWGYYGWIHYRAEEFMENKLREAEQTTAKSQPFPFSPAQRYVLTSSAPGLCDGKELSPKTHCQRPMELHAVKTHTESTWRRGHRAHLNKCLCVRTGSADPPLSIPTTPSSPETAVRGRCWLQLTCKGTIISSTY